MAKRQARALAAIAVLGALYTLGLIPVSAETIYAEPDKFPEGTDVRTAFPFVTLSVVGNPGVAVRSRAAIFVGGPTGGRNIASTGTQAFGHDISGILIPPEDLNLVWNRHVPLILRADFAVPTNFVSIDMIANDDDIFELEAFDANGYLLETVNTGSFRDDFRTVSITRATADIAYILAAGIPGEGGPLDNLQFDFVMPVHTQFISGPLKDDGGGNLVPFDVNNDGSTNAADEGKLIGVALDHAQYFAYAFTITNNGLSGALDNRTFLDVLPDGLRLSADAEASLTACTGNDCDGVVEDASGDCIVTVSGPKAKKNTIVPRYVTIETDELAASAVCTTTVYVETTGGGGKGKNAGTFEPKACEVAHTDGDPLTNTIALNDGVKMFDTAINNLWLGPIGSIQLTPQGCP